MVSYVGTKGYDPIGIENRNSFISVPVENDINIFQSLEINESIYKYPRKKFCEEEIYKTPRDIFEKILSEQGIIGQTIDNVKNKIPVLSLIGLIGSDETERKLYKYETGQISEYEAFSVVNKYGNSQRILTEFILDVTSVFISLSSLILLSHVDIELGIKITIMCLSAGLTRTIGGIIETCTQKT